MEQSLAVVPVVPIVVPKVVPVFRKLVIVCHGESENGHLTWKGMKRSEVLATVLADRLHSLSILGLCSTTLPTKQTAEIIAERFPGLTFESHPCFHSEGGYLYRCQTEDALRMIDVRTDRAEVIVLSTHPEFINQLPTIWLKSREMKIPEMLDLPEGTARIVDAFNGDVTDLGLSA